jgi:hypothetical protein
MRTFNQAIKKAQQYQNLPKNQSSRPVLASSPVKEASPRLITLLIAIISIAVVILMVILWNLANETKHPGSQAVLMPSQTAAVTTK